MRISLFLSDWIKEGKERQTSNIFLSYFLWKLFGMHELSGHFCLIVFYRAVGKEKENIITYFSFEKNNNKIGRKTLLHYIAFKYEKMSWNEMTSQKIFFFLYVFKTLPQLILWVIYCDKVSKSQFYFLILNIYYDSFYHYTPS